MRFFVWADPIPAIGSGYTRGIEVQVLVNLEWKDKKTGLSTATSQGDLFSIWGAKCVPDRPHPLGWERCIPLENRAKGEVKYYDSGNRMGPALYGNTRGRLPITYGGSNFEGYEAHGGWIASAVDLVRFASAFYDPAHCPILKKSA